MAVSDDNVELVRSTYERFNARDAAALVEVMDPDGELYPYAIDERRAEGYRGHEGLSDYLGDVGRLFERFSVDINEIKASGDDAVIARGRLRGLTHEGAEVDMAAAWLWTIRDGRVLRMQAHPTDPAAG